MISQLHAASAPCNPAPKKQIAPLFQTPMLGYFLAAALVILINAATFAQEVLVGLTSAGGVSGGGTAFSIKTNGTSFAIHKAFVNIGASPEGDLVKAFDGNFYGMTSSSEGGYGTLFKMTSAGVVTILKRFDYSTTGGYPYGSLLLGKDSALYGMTNQGGGSGTIFRVTTSGAFKVLKNLSTITGGSPYGSLVQGTDGLFYGMTSDGGTNGYGTIFKITSTGSFTLLKNLDAATTGANPHGSLVQGSDGAFYGMTNNGGTDEYGTIFKITTSGTLAVLKNLDYYTTGGFPDGSLLKASDGAFYGMTNTGGTNTYGTIFKITQGGTFSVIKNMDLTTTGIYPQGSLVQGSDGQLYGTAAEGGTYGNGVLFKLCTSGSYTVLKSLTTVNGMQPKGSLMQAMDGNFYGVTTVGGSNNKGTIFKLTSTGTLTVLKNLDDVSGTFPEGSLVQCMA
jgi:uncharacterized repeat protein (TIGR03803 family)